MTSPLRRHVWHCCGQLALIVLLTGCGRVLLRPDSAAVEPLSQVSERGKAEACRRTAEELASHGREVHAIEQLERARRYDPKIRGVAHRLAVLLDRQGRMDAADREYQIALEESPRDASLLCDYGFFHYEIGNLEEATQLLKRALKQDAKHTQALVNLGTVLAEQKKYDEAWEAFSKGVGPAAAHHNLGIIKARHGDIEGARNHLSEAIRRDPGLNQAAAVLTELSP
jgi:Tfp pilus assembly protein PilF